MNVGLPHYLAVAAILFALGLFAVLTRRNAIAMLMGIELILNSCNLNLIAFSRYVAADLEGQAMAIFVIVLAAAEAAVALAIILTVYQELRSISPDETNHLKG